MEGPRPISSKAEASAIWASRTWLLVLFGLVICQGWLVLRLFDGEPSWTSLTDDQPIIAGEHGLRLYHGYLSAKAFKESRHSSCYDPAFNGGYLQTPWFDSGSRPAALFAWLAGNDFRPSAYKIGFASSLLLVPVLIAFAAYAAGHDHSESGLAVLFGMAILWSDFGSRFIISGDLAMLLASLAGVLTIAFFARFHRTSGFGAWFGLVIAYGLMTFCQPAILVPIAPLLFISYLSVAGRHPFSWHVSLWAASLVAIAANWNWLVDGFRYWWMRTDDVLPLSAETIEQWWLRLPSLSDGERKGEGILAAALVIGGLAGCVGRKNFLAGMAAIVCLGLAVFGDQTRYLLAALLLATLPAARAVRILLETTCQWQNGRWRLAVLSSIALFGVGVLLEKPACELAVRCLNRRPIPVGLPAEADATIPMIKHETDSGARILWEETAESDAWSPLLPMLTQRAFVGGLGPSANIEHNAVAFRDGVLAGRPFNEWTENQLAEFCRLYNIGWIACRSTETIGHMAQSPLAERTVPLGGSTVLVVLRRRPSFFQVGQGRILRCDGQMLTLADVTPVDGQVVLSFHHHAGLRPSLDRVAVEKEPNPYGNIPFIRLATPSAIPQISLYWNGPP